MSNMDDFKAGKIAVWAETEDDAERFLNAVKAAGIKWKGNMPYERTNARAAREYSYGYREEGLGVALSGRGWYSRQNIPGKPYKSITVAKFFAAPKRNEQIVAYYNADGTVTCIHKKDGKVVQSATVKRYYKDADDLRVATEHALGKMLVEQTQAKPETLEYQPGDKVLVRDDLVDNKTYGVTSFVSDMRGLCGKVVTLDKKGHDSRWGVKELNAWITPEMLVGKIVSLDGLKAGDEVLVKSRSEEDLDGFQAAYANKVVTIESVDGSGDAWVQNVCFTPRLRFVGKLIRIPVKE